jgi:hypothetical protein
MVWIEDDDFSGWCCSHCQWAISPLRLDTAVAALQFNRSAQAGFEKHHCVPNSNKLKVRAQAAGKN